MRAEQLQSHVITFLRFPLAVGVIMIHASFSGIMINGQGLDNVFLGYII